MKKASFQGTSLTASQRQRLERDRQLRSLATPLELQVSETLQVLESRKEQGAKPEKVWFLVREEQGTPCLAEYFGY